MDLEYVLTSIQECKDFFRGNNNNNDSFSGVYKAKFFLILFNNVCLIY